MIAIPRDYLAIAAILGLGALASGCAVNAERGESTAQGTSDEAVGTSHEEMQSKTGQPPPEKTYPCGVCPVGSGDFLWHPAGTEQYFCCTGIASDKTVSCTGAIPKTCDGTPGSGGNGCATCSEWASSHGVVIGAGKP